MPPGSSAGGALLVVMSMGMAVMMVVIAMLVVVMVVIMVVVMMVPIMRRVAVSRVFRRVGVACARIGAAFGVERRVDLDHPCAQSLCHRLDDVIAPNPQAFCHDLGRQMAVAEMPGETNQMLRVVPSNFQ